MKSREYAEQTIGLNFNEIPGLEFLLIINKIIKFNRTYQG